MLKRADVVVIGSGGLGAATAFYLAKRDAGTVVLVDRYEIGSQTSPRAAGMVSCMRKGEVMMRLIKVAAAALQHFAEETGQPLDCAHSGSLKVARRTEDAEVIQADIARGRRLGLDVEQITLAEAHRLNPFLQTEGVAAVLRVGDDTTSQWCASWMRRCTCVHARTGCFGASMRRNRPSSTWTSSARASALPT